MKRNLDLMIARAHVNAHRLKENEGSDYVGMLIKILISVVVGALLLGLIVALVNAIWPELTARIFEMFGSGAGTSTSTSA